MFRGVPRRRTMDCVSVLFVRSCSLWVARIARDSISRDNDLPPLTVATSEQAG